MLEMCADRAVGKHQSRGGERRHPLHGDRSRRCRYAFARSVAPAALCRSAGEIAAARRLRRPDRLHCDVALCTYGSMKSRSLRFRKGVEYRGPCIASRGLCEHRDSLIGGPIIGTKGHRPDHSSKITAAGGNNPLRPSVCAAMVEFSSPPFRASNASDWGLGSRASRRDRCLQRSVPRHALAGVIAVVGCDGPANRR